MAQARSAPGHAGGSAGGSGLEDVERLIAGILSLSPDVRYAALYRGDELSFSMRPGPEGASGSESDQYEEWIVNPTLVKLLTQRGNIDYGGVHFVLIRYGHFFQLVAPIDDGHVSVCMEPGADPLKLVSAVRGLLSGEGRDALPEDGR